MSKPTRTDKERFEALYRGTYSDLLAYLVRRTESSEDAADALAEAYLVAWEKLDAIPAGDGARLWMFGVARNLQLKDHRKRRVGDTLVERLAGELRAAEPTMSPPISDHIQIALDAGLAALSDQDREILTLTAWEGLTPRQIATTMSISANAVRIRLHRARKRLSQELACGDNASTHTTPLAVESDR
jgi:RNA polymerase sigma-70 factor, ECF subfamily